MVKHKYIMVFESDSVSPEDLKKLDEQFKRVGITNLFTLLVGADTNVKLFDLYTWEEEKKSEQDYNLNGKE